ncbi:MAG: dephospho-CoA kinase [Anaerolineae bacterium]|nr:dephospho-CoA kinase [Anaerolineae bacterium]
MSAWPGKYVIGLTGNIATGKSVIRRMLEHLGAYGIDADGLTHRAMAKGAPGYDPILQHFGQWILANDGQIDRTKLGRIAFADPGALKQLETILHPFVRQAVDVLIRRANQPVIVLEAIKLLEGELASLCDSIWVSQASPETQYTRLLQKRGLSEADAKVRITSQSPQAAKVAAAHVVIDNDGSFESSWQQVVSAWEAIAPKSPEPAPAELENVEPGQLVVQRAGPKQAEEIAAFITRLNKEKKQITRTEVMAAFGEKAFMVVFQDKRLVGLVGWQVENLVSRVVDFYLDDSLSLADVAPGLMAEMEKASRELQSEAALLFLPINVARHDNLWKSLGYEKRDADSLGVRAWEEAAGESYVDGSEMLFKQLRVDRVLRPI